MLTMRTQMDVICCKSVGTDLSMLDIEYFISEICQVKKEVASLEAKLRERGDKPKREDSVWRSRDTQDSELSLTLLCYTDDQDDGSADQTSVKMGDCRNLIERREEEITAEEQQQSQEEDDEDEDQNEDDELNDDVNSGSSTDEETTSTSKEQLKVKSFSCITCGKTLSSQGYLARHERKHTEQKVLTCKICEISFPTLEEKRLHSKEHRMKRFHCKQCGKDFFTTPSNVTVHMKTHTGKKTFLCSKCDKYFHNKQVLKCPHCDRRFMYGYHLKRHVRVHTNERP
ncbi:hypothetical protein PO909_016388 [Leuciscus waleckii]